MACEAAAIPIIWLVVPKKQEVQNYIDGREEGHKVDSEEPQLLTGK